MNNYYCMNNDMFKVGDIVTRSSHRNDILFKIIQIKDDKCLLHGVDVRLIADAQLSDLVISNQIKNCRNNSSDDLSKKLDKSNYFYMPGKILHIDADKDYLQKCLDFYKENNILAYGKNIKEKNIQAEIKELLNEYNPDILVLTGHDSYKGNNVYINSKYYINSVKESRKYEKNLKDLIIIAGACQSDYIGLMKSGANFASSPNKINIHVLDPAIIAANIALSERDKEIDLATLLSKTKYGKEGIGGLKCEGLMKIGYPRIGDNNEYK